MSRYPLPLHRSRTLPGYDTADPASTGPVHAIERILPWALSDLAIRGRNILPFIGGRDAIVMSILARSEPCLCNHSRYPATPSTALFSPHRCILLPSDIFPAYLFIGLRAQQRTIYEYGHAVTIPFRCNLAYSLLPIPHSNTCMISSLISAAIILTDRTLF